MSTGVPGETTRPGAGYPQGVTEPLLVRAARRESVERTPVWFMRQAGRSLPEYRAIRERHSFFEVANEPELCAEVTLQPVLRHDVDAAVMFADIMTPVVGARDLDAQPYPQDAQRDEPALAAHDSRVSEGNPYASCG